MYQLNDTEMWRDHRDRLLKEAEDRLLARRLRAGRNPKRRNWATAALGFLATLLVVGLLVLGASPARADQTFTVNSVEDSGTGGCNSTECTLREAIVLANRVEGADTIRFDIPGEGVKTITPSSLLPTITEAVTIDGYTQPGSSPNTLAKGTNAKILIELDSTNAIGLEIEASNTTVRGLVINNSRGSGVSIDSGTGNRLEGNFLGTDASGTLDRGSFAFGAQIDGGRANTIGGTSPSQRNLISGNGAEGIEISSNSSGGNKVLGNLIGTQKDGISPLGNSDEGVYVDAPNNTIGGTDLGEANVIAFNGRQGVFVEFIEGNILNTGNRILANSIFSNGMLGIDLEGGTENAAGATKNDPKDTDKGANGLQNKPVLTSATNVGSKTTIKGKLLSKPNKTFTVHFFSNPSGTDEGKRFIGQKRVKTDSEGKVSFTFVPSRRVGAGQAITATATAAEGTSEYSAPRTVTAS